MQVDGTVYARNRMNGVTVMSSDPRSTQFVQWEAAGDEGGGDIQAVPTELSRTPAFVQAVRNGVLAVVDVDREANELDALLNKQSSAWEARQAAANADIRATIENAPNNDLVTLACIGPSGKGAGNCGESIPVREEAKFDAPPLCHRHQALAAQYVSDGIGMNAEGKQTVNWTRSVMGERNQLPPQ